MLLTEECLQLTFLHLRRWYYCVYFYFSTSNLCFQLDIDYEPILQCSSRYSSRFWARIHIDLNNFERIYFILQSLSQ